MDTQEQQPNTYAAQLDLAQRDIDGMTGDVELKRELLRDPYKNTLGPEREDPCRAYVECVLWDRMVLNILREDSEEGKTLRENIDEQTQHENKETITDEDALRYCTQLRTLLTNMTPQTETQDRRNLLSLARSIRPSFQLLAITAQELRSLPEATRVAFLKQLIRTMPSDPFKVIHDIIDEEDKICKEDEVRQQISKKDSSCRYYFLI